MITPSRHRVTFALLRFYYSRQTHPCQQVRLLVTVRQPVELV